MIIEPRAWLINVLDGVSRNLSIKFRARTSRITLVNICLNDCMKYSVNFNFLERLNLFPRTEHHILCPHSSKHPCYRVNSAAINIFVQNEVWGTDVYLLEKNL